MEGEHNKQEEQPHLEKLKAFLERSHMEYTEKRNGHSVVMEIKRKEDSFRRYAASPKREKGKQ